jgi:hypothetical protein
VREVRVVRPEDGMLIAALAVSRTPRELWELCQAIARAAVVKEQEAGDADETR